MEPKKVMKVPGIVTAKTITCKSIATMLLMLAVGMACCTELQAMQQQNNPEIFADNNISNQNLSNEFQAAVLQEILPVDLQNVTLEQGLKIIARKAGLKLVYSKNIITTGKQVSLQKRTLTLENVLWALLADTNLRFGVSSSDHLVIMKRAKEDKKTVLQRAVQQETITGTVTDGQSGETLPGVNILVKGTSTGTSTDAEGNFELTVESLQDTLVVSYIGYQTKEVPISGRTELDITLQSQTIAGEELVVVGYGTQKEQNITGSIGSVEFSEQEIASKSISDFGQALYGKIPGVRVIRGSGEPGSESTIQVRGINSISANSSPLIVVNGNPLPNYNLNMINPANIKSIEVLKDAASAAIYGSRGSNGVVLVTTRKGTAGETNVSINYSYGIQQEIDQINVMEAEEYANAAIDAAQNGWIDSGGDPDAPNTIEARGNYKYMWPEELKSPENLANTNWQDVIFRNAPMQKVNLNVSGGTQDITYSLSGGYIGQKGIVISSRNDKYSLNMRTNIDIDSWIDVGGMVNIVYGDEQEVFDRIVEWAVQYPPTYPVYDDETGYLGAPANTDGFQNWDGILFRPRNGHPLYRINDEIEESRFNGLGNIFAKISFLPSLSFKTTLNYSYQRIDNSDYQATEHNLPPAYQTQGVMNVNRNKSINYNIQSQLNYQKDFNKHHLSALVGFEYYNEKYNSIFAQRTGYNSDQIPYLSGGKDITGAQDAATERLLISYFGRANYDYRNKYLLSASLRYDGSSRFGPNNKWGIFPSASLGWVISEEPFMEDLSAVNNLKLRMSYGLTGNDSFADYRWISSINQRKVAFGDYLGTSYYEAGLTNPNLKWERTRQINFGIDIGLYSNRIQVNADYYRSTTEDLLLNVPIPAISGFTSFFQNIGELQNRGFEVGVTTHNLVGNFSWSTNINFSHNQNKVTSLGRNDAPMFYGAPGTFSSTQVINKVGEPIYNFYGLKYIGVYKNQEEIDADPASYPSATPGDGRYADINGDGVINGDDRTIIGNAEPDFTWSITNNFQFKNFDLSFLIYGIQGNEIVDDNSHRSKLYHEGRNYYEELTNRWRSEQNPGDGEHYKLTTKVDGFEKTASSYWVYDGSFIRLKNVTLGYTFSQNILDKIGMNNLRVYFSGRNLFTKKHSNVFDPENFSSSPTNARGRGISLSPYPSAKIYTVGLNISF